MTVYVLTKHWHYEGGEVVAVFSTKAAADASLAHAEAHKVTFGADWFEVDDYELDAAPVPS